MSQSLCKLYLHIIFHTKTTSPVMDEEHIPQMHAYIGALVNTTGCQVLCVGGIENHIHALILFSKTENVAHVDEEMKRNLVNLINYSTFGGYAKRIIYRIYRFLPAGLGALIYSVFRKPMILLLAFSIAKPCKSCKLWFFRQMRR